MTKHDRNIFSVTLTFQILTENFVVLGNFLHSNFLHMRIIKFLIHLIDDLLHQFVVLHHVLQLLLHVRNLPIIFVAPQRFL